MRSQEAKDWVDKIFEEISKATTIQDISNLENNLPIPVKNRLSAQTYPPIKFSLSSDEIKDLQKMGVLTLGNEISANFSDNVQEPLAKLLYALAWKNGDLRKVKHIVEGILYEDNGSEKQDGLVFFQFGKFLSQGAKEPIVDQHVLRAFGIYQADRSNEKEIARLRKLYLITRKDKCLIETYKDWLHTGPGLKDLLRKSEGFTWHLDKLLFAVGKTIKLNKCGLPATALKF